MSIIIETGNNPNFIRPEILLHPNIPKPLHGLNPRTVLGKKWWDIERQKAYEKNNYCCWACGINKQIAKYHRWLEAHEYYEYNYKKGEAKLIEIVALCHSCHNFIHSGKMEIMRDKGEMSEEKYLDIMKHGVSVLEKYDLLDEKSKTNNVQEVAEWSKWHIIIDGKSYYTKFNSIDDWFSFYNGDKE
jgi:hypothetical protein